MVIGMCVVALLLWGFYVYILFESVGTLQDAERIRIERGLPSWETIAIFQKGSPIKTAKSLITWLKVRMIGLFAAILTTAVGFLPTSVLNIIPIHNLDAYRNYVCAVGFVCGLVLAFACMDYCSTICNFLLRKQPQTECRTSEDVA